MLEVCGVRAGYEQFSVLNGVDLSISEGAFVGILGRNGVGKTTLLKSIAGLVQPTAGSVLLHGHDLVGLDATRIARRGVSLVLDRKGIFASLSVLENLQIAQRLGRLRPQRWTQDTVLAMFPRLAERISAPGGGLSGGEQQMLAIARALLTQPSLLLLDEPTEGLAPLIVHELVVLLRSLCSTGLTAIVVDQRLETVFDTCNDVVIMSRGEIAERSTSISLRNDAPLLARHLGV